MTLNYTECVVNWMFVAALSEFPLDGNVLLDCQFLFHDGLDIFDIHGLVCNVHIVATLLETNSPLPLCRILFAHLSGSFLMHLHYCPLLDGIKAFYPTFKVRFYVNNRH